MGKRIRKIKDDTYVFRLGEHIDVGDIISKIRNKKKEEQEFWEENRRRKLWRGRNNNIGLGHDKYVVLGDIYIDKFRGM